MYSPYGFHSMSKRYREEVLRDARTRHLKGRQRASRRVVSGQSRAVFTFGDALSSLLRGAGLAGQQTGRGEG